jgi:DNA-binding NarL/FixJ family response regulator
VPTRASNGEVPGGRTTVCLFSHHPLLSSEFARLLSGDRFRLIVRRVDALLADLERLPVPRATVYVVEAFAQRQTTEALVARVAAESRRGRSIVIAERLDESNAFPLLGLGVKGLLKYSEVSSSLGRALQVVAAGGFWVPRTLLSRFVDSTLESFRPARSAPRGARLSPREREVVALLLENRSNKEIASRLHMSERTAKFHVSNLLLKYGVKRRADLILLWFAEAQDS